MRTDGNGGNMTVHDDNVTITGAFHIGRLTGFEAHIIPNAHATAVIKGISKDIMNLVIWQKCDLIKSTGFMRYGERLKP